MAVLKKDYHHGYTGSAITNTSDVNSAPITTLCSTDGGSTTNIILNLNHNVGNCCGTNEVSDYFYQDLKEILLETGINITFDDTNRRFSIFGLEFATGFSNPFYHGNYLVGYLIPIITPYRVRHAEQGMKVIYNNSSWNTGNMMNQFYNDSTYMNQSIITDETTHSMTYSIYAYYNTDYLRIVYKTYASPHEIPLIFIMKCSNIYENKNMVLCATDINLQYTIANYHQDLNAYGAYNNRYQAVGSVDPRIGYPGRFFLYYADEPFKDVTLFTAYNGSYNRDYETQNISQCGLFGYNRIVYNKQIQKFIYKKVTALDGIIEFSDNLIYANENMLAPDTYYNINNSTYFFPSHCYMDPTRITSSQFLRTMFLIRI